MADRKYILKPTYTPTAAASDAEEKPPAAPADASIRAENEDDDGYDPYSDRPSDPEPQFEEDPWK